MPYLGKTTHLDEGTLEVGSRVCESCDIRKDIKEYHWTNSPSSKKTGRRRKCKLCLQKEAKARRNADQDKYRALSYVWHLKAKFNITKKQYDAILARQNGKCAICDRVLDPKSQNLKPHVDHDHKTSKVRGILCFTCNTAIGKLGDSIELLESAIKYLRNANA